MSPTESLRNFTVGAIEVSPQHNTLRLAARSITLQPKVMAVLYYLAQHQTRVVSNEELLQAVWQGRVVTLASVQKSINALRSALADLAGEQEFVSYFSKRGYQLMQPVRWADINPQVIADSTPLANTTPQTSQVDLVGPIVIDNSPADPISETSAPQVAPALVANREMGAPHKHKKLLALAGLGAMIAVGIYWLSIGLKNKPPENPPHIAAPSSSETNSDKVRLLPWQIISHYLPNETNAHHATPSPDSKRVAFLRDVKIDGGARQSDLMIRDLSGTAWLLARSDSNWVDLAWSPSGRALAALEIYRADDVFKDPDFYQSPQYLYNIHLFTLDLKGQHLLEKNLLSQWQGKVNSITWWDENTLEFIATMGASLTKERYHYKVTDQTLTSLPPLHSGFQPLVSRVRNKTTALISRLQDKTQLEFLDEQHTLISKQTISAGISELSWAADGNGVYGLDTYQNQLYFLPLQGSGYSAQLPAPLNNLPTASLSHLKINTDGSSIFISASSQVAQLFQNNPQGLSHLTDINNLVTSSVVQAPTGDGLIYATHQNNQAHIWLYENNKARLLHQTDGPLQSIVWPHSDYLLVKTNNKIARYELGTQRWTILLEDAQELTPLSYQADSQMIIAIKTINQVRNIWRINLANQQQKQLTFGEVGTARHWNRGILFQYANQAGLWQLNTQEPNHKAMGDLLPQHSQILGTTENSVFFVTGGPCHESDIQQLDLIQNRLTPYLKRDEKNVRSLDFAAGQGVLQIPCTNNSFMSYEIRRAE